MSLWQRPTSTSSSSPGTSPGTRAPQHRQRDLGLQPADRRQQRRKGSDGNWEDKPNYFDVTVWGAQGENCANYLSKGRPVAIEGRLEWREWETKEGQKRQNVEIIANCVQFLGSRDGSGGGGNGNGFTPQSDVPADTSDFEGASVGGGSEDDIPF